MDKKTLSERDIITKFVHEALRDAGWNLGDQMREEFPIAAERVSARGLHGPRRVAGTAKRADIVLFHKPGIPLAVIEAKDNNHAVGAGMEQALGYADRLGLKLAYSTNGDAFLESDRTGASKQIEREVPLARPSPKSRLRCGWQAFLTMAGCRKMETLQDRAVFHGDAPSRCAFRSGPAALADGRRL